MKYDGVKLFKVNHEGYHDMSNVAQPLTKDDFNVAIKAIKNRKVIYPQVPIFFEEYYGQPG